MDLASSAVEVRVDDAPATTKRRTATPAPPAGGVRLLASAPPPKPSRGAEDDQVAAAERIAKALGKDPKELMKEALDEERAGGLAVSSLLGGAPASHATGPVPSIPMAPSSAPVAPS